MQLGPKHIYDLQPKPMKKSQKKPKEKKKSTSKKMDKMAKCPHCFR